MSAEIDRVLEKLDALDERLRGVEVTCAEIKTQTAETAKLRPRVTAIEVAHAKDRGIRKGERRGELLRGAAGGAGAGGIVLAIIQALKELWP